MVHYNLVPVSRVDAARTLLARRRGRREFKAYVDYTRKAYLHNPFSDAVCVAINKFVDDVIAGKRPILVLQAPPQHGKSELVSRLLPAYLVGRFPDWNIGAMSYSDELANTMSLAVRRNVKGDRHQKLFPSPNLKRPFDINRMGEFTSPGGMGSYFATGVGGGITGKPLDIGIIDDPIKNEKEALSPTMKEGHWNWYQSVFTTRMSEHSGQIIMATSWAEDDLPARVCKHYQGDPRLTILRFPALNLPTEVGYNASLPAGALAPQLKSLQFLSEIKTLFSDYWWAALYQQTPRSLGGNIFKDRGVRHYLPKDLPLQFDKVIASLDATFKDTDGTDFVVLQVWGKKGANAYLLDQARARMSFTKTIEVCKDMKLKWPNIREFYIEDKANGPAIIDSMKKDIPGIVPVEPDGSKEARAHAVTAWWEAGNVWLPHPDLFPWVRALVDELTAFPAGANDDQVDALTQALRKLYPLFSRLAISQEALMKAKAGTR